jgi:hypothetical protein
MIVQKTKPKVVCPKCGSSNVGILNGAFAGCLSCGYGVKTTKNVTKTSKA